MGLIRRPNALETVIDETSPNVVLVDTGFPEGRGFTAIEDTLALAPGAAVLALTPDPPPHDDIALATRAGKASFSARNTIWVAAVHDAEPGEVLNTAVTDAAQPQELSLDGITSANIVMTGGGSGPDSPPLRFSLDNID